jgi:hypothetical protein
VKLFNENAAVNFFLLQHSLELPSCACRAGSRTQTQLLASKHLVSPTTSTLAYRSHHGTLATLHLLAQLRLRVFDFQE